MNLLLSVRLSSHHSQWLMFVAAVPSNRYLVVTSRRLFFCVGVYSWVKLRNKGGIGTSVRSAGYVRRSTTCSFQQQTSGLVLVYLRVGTSERKVRKCNPVTPPCWRHTSSMPLLIVEKWLTSAHKPRTICQQDARMSALAKVSGHQVARTLTASEYWVSDEVGSL